MSSAWLYLKFSTVATVVELNVYKGIIVLNKGQNVFHHYVKFGQLFQQHLKWLKGCKVKIHLEKSQKTKNKKQRQLCIIICNLITVNTAIILVYHESNLVSDYSHKSKIAHNLTSRSDTKSVIVGFVTQINTANIMRSCA